ncbi:MAG: UDP-N-acetylmuramate dehydrogenase [Calditrichaeota bacterium]|nr:MAG: UDP-N-acetylmuramate dehydrogenase [Calditrichota bacterium]
MNIEKELKKFFQGQILKNEPLKNHTSLQVGGPADFYLYPKDEKDLSNLIKFINQNKVHHFFIGTGRNILISDIGIRGIVIDLSKTFDKIEILNLDEIILKVGSGVTLKELIDFCIENSFGGMEKMSGIPSSVGGAYRMNAGAFGTEIADCTISVTLMDKFGEVKTYPNEELGFEYRKSKIQDIVLYGTLQFQKSNRVELEEIKKEILKKRNSKQPLEYPSAGSFFKKTKDGIPAGILIEKCGLKGKTIGGALVTEKHANFIVNAGNAKASEILALLRFVQTEVYKNFGVKLENEVKLIGFSDGELAEPY